MNEGTTSSSIRYSPDFRKNNGCCFFCHELFLPEQASEGYCYLRRALARRRTASASAPSSGQHSLAGGEQITGTVTPARDPFPGGGHQLLEGLSLPEQGIVRRCHLRRALVRRMTASASAPSSGQHSLAGVETITGNRNSGEKPVPRRRAPAPLRVVFAGAGGCKRASAPIRPRSLKKSVPLMSQLRLTFACRSRDYYR